MPVKENKVAGAYSVVKYGDTVAIFFYVNYIIGTTGTTLA
jgi:hypothetical protein